MDMLNRPHPPHSDSQAQPPYYLPPFQPPQPQNPLMELFKMAKAMLWNVSFISYLIIILFSFTLVLAMTPGIQHWITTPVPSSEDPSVMLYPQEDIFLITPFYLHLFYLGGIGFRIWHILILGVLTAGIAQAIYGLWKKWMSRPNRITRSLTVPEKADSSLEGVAKLFMASLSFSFIYFLFLYLINVEMNTPPFDELSTTELIYALFSASVFEELISRVLLIGVPLVFLGIMLKWKQPHKKLLGGGLDLTPATMVLITISAVIFALAHVGGWDYWKVPQVLIPGFALGWAFVRYGLHASMLIHFSMNCTDVASEIWVDNLALQAALGFIYLIWIVAGAYFLFVYSRNLMNKLVPRPAVQQPQYPSSPQYAYVPPPPVYVQQAPPSAYYPPPPPQYQYYPPPPQAYPSPPPAYRHPPPTEQGGFVCPYCGHTGAAYEPGKLICLRCGQTYYREMPPPPPPEKEQFEY